MVRGGPGFACHVGSSLLEKDGQTPGWDRERHPEVGPGRGSLLAFPGKGRVGERKEGRNSPKAVDTRLLPDSAGAGKFCV